MWGRECGRRVGGGEGGWVDWLKKKREKEDKFTVAVAFHISGSFHFKVTILNRSFIIVILVSFILDTENAYFSQLKTLIEETYTLNNQRKVVIITHSLGGLFGLYFLNHMEQSWKEKYVQAYAPIASPFAGAAKVMRLFASGKQKCMASG